MQPSILHIVRKEVAVFFMSPIAYIFFGSFLLVALFIFFWVETFFARNIADVIPLFEWVPILLIFLVAALTMRMWSEERRAGTLELLLTQPVSLLRFVGGKFLACLALVAIALILTLPLPLTISLLGNLDWGAIFAGYVASLLLAAAYIAIGLSVSAKTSNQIVSLIVTVLICAILYLLGADTVTSLLGNRAGELFKAWGSGSRFESITRGVIDLRDLYYYVSIIGVFIALQMFFLEESRWPKKNHNRNYRNKRLLTLLVCINFIVANFWLAHVDNVRIDITEGKIYSISKATQNYLQQLQEPLLIRGYFSAKTHPLLASLIPQLKSLIKEYKIAGNGKIRIEFIDPQKNPELEKEAGQKYGIKPVPFQITDKYQTSLVNSYFNIVMQYGDQHQVLGFQDLIEIKSQTESDLEVRLRNPEYEITRNIKKALYQYQSGDDLFHGLEQPLKFTGYFSADDNLPVALALFKKQIKPILKELSLIANGKFKYQYIDPTTGTGATAKLLQEQYGIEPMQAGLLDKAPFYFYILLENSKQVVQLSLPENLDKEKLKLSIIAAVKRFSKGVTKTVAVHIPPFDPNIRGKQFRLLINKLQENHQTELTSLDKGIVPENADFLAVLAPTEINEKQLFAIDQFLMKGGTVLLATSPFSIDLNNNLRAIKHQSGIEDWLQHHGVNIDNTMVLDPQNSRLPIPVQRNLGGFLVQEMQMLEYPYFIDIRSSGLADKHAITSNIAQISLHWVSPISLDKIKNKQRSITSLLSSSPEAWLASSLNMLPDFERYGGLGFAPTKQIGKQQLGVVISGRFNSYFKNKPSPLASVIERSAESSKIIILASNEFLADQNLQLAASAGGMEYLNSLQFIENIVDWSLEDAGLLSIRSRSHYARTLYPLDRQTQVLWEYGNYALGLLSLFLVGITYHFLRRKTQQQYNEILHQIGASDEQI